MKYIYFMDTSVLLNLLRVPRRYSDEKAQECLQKFRWIHQHHHSIILPLPVVIEAGNEINNISHEKYKRECVDNFIDFLQLFSQDKSPFSFSTYDYYRRDVLPHIIQEYKTYTLQHKTGMGDVMIRKHYEHLVNSLPKNNNTTIEIWSYDKDLSGYSQII